MHQRLGGAVKKLLGKEESGRRLTWRLMIGLPFFLVISKTTRPKNAARDPAIATQPFGSVLKSHPSGRGSL